MQHKCIRAEWKNQLLIITNNLENPNLNDITAYEHNYSVIFNLIWTILILPKVDIF